VEIFFGVCAMRAVTAELRHPADGSGSVHGRGRSERERTDRVERVSRVCARCTSPSRIAHARSSGAPVQHATRGTIDVNDLLTTLAGHAIHHLKQLQQLR
jgi:hypothetical protein